MPEVLDIVVRQRGAKKVSRDIAQIGIAANSARDAVRGLQVSLDRTKGGMAAVTAQTQRGTVALKGFAGAGVTAKRSLTAIGTGFALVGGAITFGFAKPLLGAISAAGDFQQAMSLTGVLVQVDRTSAAFAQLEQQAKQLGLTTQFSATQAAEGMQFLAKAGLDVQEVMGAIEPTTNLAAAAGLDLARAADISTNILRGYRQEVDELPAAIDVMAATFTNANTDIEELARAFEKAGPVAVDLGQSFTGTASVIAALADAGIKASSAGTSLRRIFINLQKDSAKSNSVLRRLGISIEEVGEDGVKRMRPLNEIFQDVAASSATTEQKINLFGARALAAAGILSNASGELESFAGKIGDSVGRAAEVGGARLIGFKGAVVLMRSALEGLGIAIAESGLLDLAQKIVEGTTRVVRALADLPRPIKAFIGIGGAMAAVVALLTLKVGLFTIALGVLGISSFKQVADGATGALKALGRFALFFVTNPIGIFITAVGLATLLLFKLRNEVITFGDKTFRLRDLIGATMNAIVDSLKVAADFWSKFFASVRDGTTSLGVNLRSALNLTRAFVNAFIGAFKLIGEFIGAVFGTVFGATVNFVKESVDLVKGIPGLLKRALRGEDVSDALAKPFTTTFAGLSANLDTFIAESKDTLTKDYVGAFGDSVLGVLDQFDILENAQKRFLDSQKRTAEEAAKTGKQLAERAPGEVTAVPRFSNVEIARSAKAFTDLLGSIDKTTEAEKKFAKAVFTIRDAQQKGIIVSDEARESIEKVVVTRLFEDWAGQTDEVAGALNKANEELRLLARFADTGAISGDRLAEVQRRIGLATEEVLLQMPEFTSSLKTTELLSLSIRKGFQGFADGIGSEFELISGFVQDAFEGATGAVEKFLTTGEVGFKEFALSVVNDLQKVILKLIALQAVRAFEQRGERGGGVGGFLGGLFGPRLGATQREVAPEVAGRLEQLGTATNPANSVIKNAENEPIPTKLIDPDSTGIVGLRDPIVNALTGPQGLKGTLVEQFQQLGSTIQNFAAAIPGVAGAGGQQVTGAVEQLGATTNMIGEAQKAATEVGTGAIEKTNQGGFAAVGGFLTTGFSSLLNFFVGQRGEGQKQGLFGGIGTILGGLAGFIPGAQAFAPLLKQIGGQAGNLLGGLQEGGQIRAGQVGKSFLVGEKGIELFTPPTTGTVVPNDMLSSMVPELNVKVVNVDDARSVPEAMSTGEGEQVVMNIIQRNRGQLREIIS